MNKLDLTLILNKIKIEIEKIEQSHHKVTNKKVGEYLGIAPTTLGTMLNREKIPFKQIVDFCNKYDVDMNYILKYREK